MPQYRATVGADAIVTLPAPLCKKLRIAEGSVVEFYLSLEGDVFFHAITGKAKAWRSAFGTEVRSPPLSIREMDAAVGEALVEDDNRIRRGEARRSARRRRSAAE